MSEIVYLVHIHLVPHPAGMELPGYTAAVITAALPVDAGVHHVSVHPSDGPNPVVGLYLESRTLSRAEALARDLWETVADSHAWLRGWAFLRAEVPLIPVRH
ncbi:hypothetical protein OG244_24075 [Streptomyces brevispora]|uniref:hypothetical protein n=1 Tax=Streptomyces brevispora TaxID=887462 RepID=UPI002E311B1F|nr:hypothetical protein [Streptomyces brevispora]